MQLALLPQDTLGFGRTPAHQNGPAVPPAAPAPACYSDPEWDDLDEIFGPVDPADLRPPPESPLVWTPLAGDVAAFCRRLRCPEVVYYDEQICTAADTVLRALGSAHGPAGVREAFRVLEALRPAVEALPGMRGAAWPGDAK